MSNVPPAPPQPPPTAEQAAQKAHQRQLRMSYGMLFASEHGKIVLADLKARYGWDGDIERPVYRAGQSFDQTAAIDAMREPVRHILAMQTVPDDKPQPKPTTATS